MRRESVKNMHTIECREGVFCVFENAHEALEAHPGDQGKPTGPLSIALACSQKG